MSGEDRPPCRIAMIVEYDGTALRGLQRQSHTSDTVQEHIEVIARRVGSPDPRFVASGRTDAGVHAQGQVIVLDLPERLDVGRIPSAFNAMLPPDIRIRRAVRCSPGFNPRLDARRRLYIYRLSSRNTVSPIYRHFVAHTQYSLDPGLTVAAARAFKGKWELCQWRSSICQSSRTLLTIDEADAIPPGEAGDAGETRPPWWQFRFRARSFLHHQVRFMVGGVVAVGSGRLALEELKKSLAEGVRPGIVKCEAAAGLCFTHVEFAHGKDPFHATPDPREQHDPESV